MWERFQTLPWARPSISFALGVLASLLGLAVGIYLLILLSPALTGRPLVAELADSGVSGSVCPGQRMTTTLSITIEDKQIVDIFTSVMDESVSRTIIGNPVGTMMRPFVGIVTYEQPLPWEIPDLPPGNYNQVRGYSVRGSSADPEYVIVPFVIREPRECP